MTAAAVAPGARAPGRAAREGSGEATKLPDSIGPAGEVTWSPRLNGGALCPLLGPPTKQMQLHVPHEAPKRAFCPESGLLPLQGLTKAAHRAFTGQMTPLIHTRRKE